ncbi:MAG: murein biosynthesis integral membrane protein MurJ [Candidatus Omnitrophota bacterium]
MNGGVSPKVSADGHRQMLKSAGAIGALTGVSRVLGFVRDMVIASAFGTGIGAEAFVVSFKIPNLLRDLVGEGAANAAFVPVLTECRQKQPKDYWSLVSSLFFVLAGILLVISVLGVLLAPAIVRLLAPGFVDAADPGKFPLTVRLTRIIFPYILLIGLSALAMGVLNSLREFTSSALGPILMNVCMIVAGVFFERQYGPMALVVGVLAGGFAQLFCQIGPLTKRGFRLVTPGVGHGYGRKIIRLLIPRAVGSGLYQVNVFVDSILASFERIVGPGGQSALYYSNRLFQLPLAIFGVSLAQAVLPTFSSQMVDNDREAFKRTFSMTVRMLTFAALPAAVGLIVLSEPIVRIIFQRGRFDGYSTSITSSALFFYGFGLWSCCLIKIMANSFYAMQDTRTPVKVMGVSVLINVILSLMLMRTLKIAGLALASSLSAAINLTLLYYFLRRRVGPIDEVRILKTLGKVLAASAAMGLFNAGMCRLCLGPPGAGQILILAGCIIMSIVLYFALCVLLRLEEAHKILSWRRRKI